PAAESRGARCLCETGALLRGEREQALELGAEFVGVARLEAGEVPELGRVLRLEPFGDLLEAGVPGDERRATGGSGLGGDPPERLGEDRRDDAGVTGRRQVDEG